MRRDGRGGMERSHEVVGAIVVDSLSTPTSVLAARRSTGAPDIRGRWEFPGGKVEPGENHHEALVREIHEELGARVRIGTALVHPDGFWRISDRYRLHLYFAEVADGRVEPSGSHDSLVWLSADQLWSLDWLPADAQALPGVVARLV